MSFENNIKKWVTIDNQIRELNDSLKILRDEKNNITNELNKIANENENYRQAKININGGSLKFQVRKETKPLSLKFIKSCLKEFISDEDNVDKVINYIKESREFSYVEEIKRTYNKE